MVLEDLLKTLELDGDDQKEKANVLAKELKERETSFNDLSKKVKELEEANIKFKEGAEADKAIVDKFNIAAKAFGFDLEAEDYDKMLDDVKDKLSKGSGNVTDEDFKQVNRDLTKAKRELEKSNATIKDLTTQLEAEKITRINGLKRGSIRKELENVNALNPEMFVDLFMNKVSVDEDGKTLSMKDAAGNEISLADGIADWAKANTDLVKKSVKGGLGSNGGNGNGGNGVSDFVKSMIANKTSDNNNGGKSLAEMFG